MKHKTKRNIRRKQSQRNKKKRAGECLNLFNPDGTANITNEDCAHVWHCIRNNPLLKTYSDMANEFRSKSDKTCNDIIHTRYGNMIHALSSQKTKQNSCADVIDLIKQPYINYNEQHNCTAEFTQKEQYFYDMQHAVETGSKIDYLRRDVPRLVAYIKSMPLNSRTNIMHKMNKTDIRSSYSDEQFNSTVDRLADSYLRLCKN